MNFDRKKLKLDARGLLSGNFGFAVMALCIILLIEIGIGFVTFLIFALSKSEGVAGFVQFIGAIYIMLPLNFGLVILFYKIGTRQTVTNKTILEVFSNKIQYLNVIILYILISMFVSLWTLLLIVPGIIASLRYSQAPYILLENPGMTPMEAIRRSKEMTKGFKGSIFMLNLSFLGWMLLAPFTFGILYLWLIPYIGETNVQLYFFLKEAKPSAIEVNNG
ncbi:MAG: DUF975 family protein [Lachnospiraceae bacterium]